MSWIRCCAGAWTSGRETGGHVAAQVALVVVAEPTSGGNPAREALTEENPIIGNARTIDVQMTRLRRKIETNPKYPRFLQTVRGTGYVLLPD